MPNASITSLRKRALSLPEAEEGTSCNKACFKAGKKNFLFVGEYEDRWDAMLKLGGSLPEAEALAAKDPDRFSAGSNGWVTATFAADEKSPASLIEGWVEESYRLLVPKKLVAQLDG